MPAYTPHTLITFGGTLAEQAAADEIWECGIRGGDPVTSFAPVDPSQHSALLGDIIATAPTFESWFTGTHSLIPSTVTCDFLKAVNIGADGKYTSDPVVVGSLGLTGPEAGSGVPSFCSVALSWRTGASGKRNRNGRIYPPNFAAPVDSGKSTVQSATIGSLLTGAIALIHAFTKSGSEFSFEPHVVSSLGGHAKITSCRVGNVYDVQRRRKDKVPESYATGAV